MRTLLVAAAVLLVAPVALSQDGDEGAMRALVDGIARGDAAALRHARRVVSRRNGARRGTTVRNAHTTLAWIADARYVPQGTAAPDDGTTSWWTCSVPTSTCTVRQPGGDTVLELRRAHGAWELVAILSDDP